MNKTEIAEVVQDTRIKAWIYAGVEAEIELHQLRVEQTWATTSGEDKMWNDRRIEKLGSTVAMVNRRIDELTK